MITRTFFRAAGPVAPTRVGTRPRTRLRALGAAALLGAAGVALVAATAAGCSNGSSDQVTPPVALGMTDSIAAYYSDQQISIYEVQKPVPLPVRAPSDQEIQALGPAPAGTPYPRAPYLKADDERVEVHYTISNIDDQEHTVWLLIDPWNEFVRWNPGVQVVSDEETVPNYGYDLPFIVQGKSRVQGTITPDDMHEIAIKLASVENLLASPQAKAAMSPDAGAAGGGIGTMLDVTGVANNIFNPLNRSNGGDPIYTPWIPPVIAGVTGFDLGLRTFEPASVAVEITIDVQDLNGNRFVEAGSSDILGPPSKTLSPPAARF